MKAVIALLLAVASTSPTVDAAPRDVGEPTVFAAFDGASGHLPEGVALDRRGNAFVSLGPPFFTGGAFGEYGEVRRLGRDGSSTTLLRFDEGPAPAGLVVDRRGAVYAAVPDPAGSAVGIYRLRDGRAPERVEGSEQMRVPNGLAVDWRGTLYASDSDLGQVWRVDRRGRSAEPWLGSPLLEGCGDPGAGANGIVVRSGAVYAANTDRGLLVRIPILRDGSAGDPQIVAGDDDCDNTDELWGIDGIAFDVRGNIYATLVLNHQLVRIDRDRSVEVLLTAADGLWNPASLAFGTDGHQRSTLYIANYAVLPPEPPGNLGPAILSVDVGVRGQLVPCRCPGVPDRPACPIDR